jgi:hypothetical protein
MSNTNDQRLIRFTKVLVDVIYFLLIGASVLLAVWILTAPIIGMVLDIPITASVLVAIGAGSDPQIPVEIA